VAAWGIEIARLGHMGIVAGLCREIGIAEDLDARDTRTPERVSVATATVAIGQSSVRVSSGCGGRATAPPENAAGPAAGDAQREQPPTLCGGKGRPSKGQLPDRQTWHVHAQLTLDDELLEWEAQRQARFVVGTNVLDATALPDEDVIGGYNAQSGVEPGFVFLKDPLFLASSVFLKRPERIMALAFIMTLCLLVYKLAEVRLRHRFAATGQTVPDQKGKPTARPTLRWLFQCFEGIDLHHTRQPSGMRVTDVLRLTKVHRLVLRLLGPAYENGNLTFQETVG
jgi:hypothetical protein